MKRRFLRPLVKFLKKLTRAGVPVVRACRVAVAVPIASEARMTIEFLITTLIVVISLSAIRTLGTNAKTTFTNVGTSLSGS